MTYRTEQDLPGTGTVIERLYRHKPGPIIKPELPPGAKGTPPKAVDRANHRSLADWVRAKTKHQPTI